MVNPYSNNITYSLFINSTIYKREGGKKNGENFHESN